jgi:hypothetical protein
MIAQHASLAQTLAEQLDLPSQVREAVSAAYEQWDGPGWPGVLKADAVPMAARVAQLRLPGSTTAPPGPDRTACLLAVGPVRSRPRSADPGERPP